MWRNYGLPAANILVSSLPLLMTWDPVVGICYCGILALFLALFSWNVVGDFVVVLFVLHAKVLPSDAAIAPILKRYIHSLRAGEQQQHEVALYYADSKIPYYIPVSTRNAVVSLALEDRLQQNGERLLIKGVPKDAYIPKIMISRKAALLSLTSYAVVIRIMELWVHYLAVREKWLMRYLSARQSEALCRKSTM